MISLPLIALLSLQTQSQALTDTPEQHSDLLTGRPQKHPEDFAQSASSPSSDVRLIETARSSESSTYQLRYRAADAVITGV
ncbi:MAG: hypothetical protein ACT4TC_25460, partial [Myxococcaceae bacterium]